MARAEKTKTRYNYAEFRHQYWDDVLAVKSTPVATEHFLKEAFRDAANECSKRGRFVVLSGVAFVTKWAARAAFIAPPAALAITKSLGVEDPITMSYGAWSWAASGALWGMRDIVLKVNGNGSANRMYDQQFGKAKDDFALWADARGNKRVYRLAASRVRATVGTAKPVDGPAPALN